MATHSNILAWEILWTEEPGRLQSMESPRVGCGFSSVHVSRSVMSVSVTPWTEACQASLSIIKSQSLLKLIHWVSDAIQPSWPLLSPSSPSFNLSQHQGLCKWVSSSHQVAKVLEFQLQHQSFQWIFRTNFLQDRLVGFPCSPRDSRESSPTPQFKGISSSMLGLLYGPTLTSIHDYWKSHNFD